VKIAVFDFDGTLVNTPSREVVEKIFADNGSTWEHVGFYGRIESLLPPAFPQTPDPSYAIAQVAQAYQNCDADLKILLTGRPYKVGKRVEEICKALNYSLDEYYFRGHKGFSNKDTMDFKKSVLLHLLKTTPSQLSLWEDREEHAILFEAWFESITANYPQTDFILHRVTPPTP
jgi:hypothetical protein